MTHAETPDCHGAPSGFDENGERISLLDQLKLNKERKHVEMQQQQHSQNSQYKLDEASAQFYESLRQSTLQHDQNERSQIQHQLQEFRLKQNAARAEPLSHTDSSIPSPPSPKRKVVIGRPSVRSTVRGEELLAAKKAPANSAIADNRDSAPVATANSAAKIIEGYSSSDEE